MATWYCVVILWCLSAVSVCAQFSGRVLETADSASRYAEPRVKYGMVGGLALDQHSAEFSALPGIPSCCPGFRSASGFGPYGEALFSWPIIEWLRVQARAGAGTHAPEFRSSEIKPVLGADNLERIATIEHQIDADMAAWDASLLLGWEPLGPDKLEVFGGGSILFPLSAEYTQREVLLEPAGGTFEDGRGVRNESSGDIPQLESSVLFLRIGASWELPLSAAPEREWRLAPQLSYMYALNSLVEGIDWSPHHLRLGVGIVFAPAPDAPVPPPPPPPPPPDTVIVVEAETPPPPPPPYVTVEVRSLESDGSTREDAVFVQEERLTQHFQPLLPYIFFEQSSAALPLRYKLLDKNGAARFSPAELPGGSILESYYHELNVIGYRMQLTPEARLMLRGYTTPGESRAADGARLAQRRAASVKQYLVEAWGIATDRIDVGGGALPPNASSTTSEQGRQENRRVEISSSHPDILGPVIVQDTVREMSPPAMRIFPLVNRFDSLTAWSVSVERGGVQLKQFSGTERLPDSLDWRLPPDLDPDAGDLQVRAFVSTKEGAEAQSFPENLAVRRVTVRRRNLQRRGDVSYERYTVLFPYRSSGIDELNNYSISFIADRIGPESRVRIVGYTDVLGEADYNRKLSAERARSVAQMLNVDPVNSSGAGETEDLFNNDLPEGRFYSRTVEVFIETPIDPDGGG